MKRWLPVLIPIILLLVWVPIGNAVITCNTDDYYLVGNETYGFAHAMTFSYMKHNSSYILFNGTYFNFTSANSIDITLSYLHENYSNASKEDKVLEFYANAASGNVDFNLSGFPVGEQYLIKKNNVYYTYSIADSSGNISFYNNAWSNVLFTIYENVASLASSFTYILRGQILELNPTLGSSVLYYKWIITDNNSVVGETSWMPESENCSTKYQLNDGANYHVTLGYKNNTESEETSVTIHIPKRETEDILITEDVDEEEDSPYNKLFEDQSTEINQWLADRNPGEWFIFSIVSLIIIFMLYSHKKNKKKKYFIVNEVKKNEGK